MFFLVEIEMKKINESGRKSYRTYENRRKTALLLLEAFERNQRQPGNEPVYILKEYLIERFDVSEKSIYRYIEHLILKWNFKIDYDRKKKGYILLEEPRLKDPWNHEIYNEDVIMSLILAERLSTAIPKKKIKDTIRETIAGMHKSIDWKPETLQQKISLKNIKYTRPNATFFVQIIQALKTPHVLNIAYLGISADSVSQRMIKPLHLVLYSGNWTLIAYCESRQGIRFFNLSRIVSIDSSEQKPFDWELYRKQLTDILIKMDDFYGIFITDREYEVELCFSKKIRNIVKNLQWTPSQKMEDRNGEITVTFKVGDFTEIKNDILSFGENINVVKPKALRDQVIDTIQQMASNYQIKI